MVDQQKIEELQRCIESPYYFFMNHIKINNESVHTFLTEEEFNLIFNQLVRNGNK